MENSLENTHADVIVLRVEQVKQYLFIMAHDVEE